MSTAYQALLQPITLPNGVELKSRTTMSPMVVKGANDDGTISKLDLAYFDKRSDVSGLIITGAAYVNELGCGFDGQISVSKDEDIAGLTKLAKVIKKDGNKAILQLHHAGREALYDKLGKVVAPSAIEFPFLTYLPEEMTNEDIEQTIKDFGKAAKRAIAAGFDGVEVHGANHYLLQQFFSVYSNQRNDRWGGSLEKRMAFPLAVLNEVQRVSHESGMEGFIVGYRLCPDEIHEETTGYTFDEAIQLIEKIVSEHVDYIHLSIFTGYTTGPANSDQSFGQLVKKQVDGRCPVIIVSNVFTADDAIDALHHGDIVAIGRAALQEPEFTKKIKEGRVAEIHTTVGDNLENLALPEKLIDWLTMENSPLPPLPGLKK